MTAVIVNRPLAYRWLVTRMYRRSYVIVKSACGQAHKRVVGTMFQRFAATWREAPQTLRPAQRGRQQECSTARGDRRVRPDSAWLLPKAPLTGAFWRPVHHRSSGSTRKRRVNTLYHVRRHHALTHRFERDKIGR